MPAGASRPAGTPVPSAQLLEPHSSASRQCLLHCVHHGIITYHQKFMAQERRNILAGPARAELA